MGKKEIVRDYDMIRVLGTMLVVAGHSAYTTMVTDTGGIIVDVKYGTAQEMLLLLVRLIYSFHMPLFIALSGALYWHTNEKNKNFGEMIERKFHRLMVPFFAVNIFWSIPLKLSSGYWDGKGGGESKIWNIFWGQFVLLDNNYLWYLVSLFWIFCIFHVLYKYIRNEIFIALICFAAFVCGQHIPWNYFGIQRCFSHMIWFYCGILFDRNRLRIRMYLRRPIIQIAFYLIAGGVYMAYLFCFKTNAYFYIIVGGAGIGITYLLAMYLANTEIMDPKVFKEIFRYSFQIYLFSDPLNYVLLNLLKVTGMASYYCYNSFCIAIFVIRIVLTTAIAVIMSKNLETVLKRRRHAQR